MGYQHWFLVSHQLLRDKLSLADFGGAGKVESPPGAAETPVPQSADPESLQLCDPGSGMGNGNSWGACPTGTPIAEGFPFPELLGVKYSYGAASP